MMKKITRIAALLATSAFLLAGFPACSDDEGDDDPTLAKIEINADGAKTEYNVGDPFDKADITVTAKYSDGSTKDVTDKATVEATYEDAPFTTAEAGTYDVILTATYEGKTSEPVTCTITVKNGSSDGDTEQGGGDGNGDGDNPENPPEEIPEGLTVAQKVTDEAVTETGWYQTTANTSGNIVQQTADGAISVNIKDSSCPTPEYILKDAISGAVKITATFNITQAGNSCGIMEILDADGNALFQPARINGYNASSGITITTRSGSENTQKSPTIALGTDFTVETTINFDAGKFQTKVDATSLPVQTFSGEDKALKAIKFNPKTSGTVMTISGVTVTEVAQEAIPDDLKPTVFKSETVTVPNDEATLGITATEVTSDNEAVATVERTDNESIKITSVKPGVATITAKADDKTATIKVTVADDGAITTKVTKYVDSNTVTSWFAEVAGSDTTKSTEKFSANDVIAETNSFKIVAIAAMEYSVGNSYGSISTGSNATTYTNNANETVKPDQGIKNSTNIEKESNVDTFKVTAKSDVTLLIYCNIVNDSYNSNRTGGTITYTVDTEGSEAKKVSAVARKQLVKLEVELKAGESVIVNGAMDNSNTAKLWLFGVEPKE